MARPTITPQGGSTVTYVGSQREGNEYPSEESRDISRANVNGRAKKLTGRKSQPRQMRFNVDVDPTPATLKAKLKEIYGHAGTFVTFVNSFGVSEVLFVENVTIYMRKAELSTNGESGVSSPVWLDVNYVFSDTRTS